MTKTAWWRTDGAAYVLVGCNLASFCRCIETHAWAEAVGPGVMAGVCSVLVALSASADRKRADVGLLAAAPDMLAALQAYEDALALNGAGSGFEREIDAAAAKFDVLRKAALAKATRNPEP